MGEVVNLNRARKAKAKLESRAIAEANRAKFGRSKAAKQREQAERARAEKLLDGARLDD